MSKDTDDSEKIWLDQLVPADPLELCVGILDMLVSEMRNGFEQDITCEGVTYENAVRGLSIHHPRWKDKRGYLNETVDLMKGIQRRASILAKENNPTMTEEELEIEEEYLVLSQLTDHIKKLRLRALRNANHPTGKRVADSI